MQSLVGENGSHYEAQGGDMDGPPGLPAGDDQARVKRLQTLTRDFRDEFAARHFDAAARIATDAIEFSRDVCDIDTSAAKGVEYDSRLTRSGRFSRETQMIKIGPAAMSSAGFLGSVIDHEAYHAFVFRDVGPQPYVTRQQQALVEIPVYDHSLGTNQVERFGLTRLEVLHLQSTRNGYLNDLYGPGS